MKLMLSGIVHNVRRGEDSMNECKCCRELERRIEKLEFDIRMDKIEQMQIEIEQSLDKVNKKLDDLNG